MLCDETKHLCLFQIVSHGSEMVNIITYIIVYIIACFVNIVFSELAYTSFPASAQRLDKTTERKRVMTAVTGIPPLPQRPLGTRGLSTGYKTIRVK
ncbi:hypothetical protein SDC9_181686 [bioreactor metagenome]|uniref:Uncharacterized protein n=1 Tax=bioreactor metagenome TaxID=1076179 RepID=A0A645HER7_9ZZZZ